MSVFNIFENAASVHSPLAQELLSNENYINLEFDILYPISIPINLPRSFCPHRHYHFNHLSPFSLLPSADFSDAELSFRSIGDLLATLQLESDRDIGPCSERKWKRITEIMGKKGARITLKCSCTAEDNGVFKKSIEYQGKGKFVQLGRMYTFCADSVSMQDVCERSKREKEVRRAMALPVEISDGTYQQVGSKIKASVKRTVHTPKGKKKELSPQDAAMLIQKTFRDYLLRRSQVIHSFRDLAVVKSKMREIRVLFSKFSYRYRLSKDAEERQRFFEKIIVLLRTVDAIEGHDFMVRSGKRSISRELEAVLQVLDPQPCRELGSMQPKFDLLATSFSTEIVSGVADIIRMLDEEDCSGSSILTFSSL